MSIKAPIVATPKNTLATRVALPEASISRERLNDAEPGMELRKSRELGNSLSDKLPIHIKTFATPQGHGLPHNKHRDRHARYQVGPETRSEIGAKIARDEPPTPDSCFSRHLRPRAACFT
jgi:hypothetical protein